MFEKSEIRIIYSFWDISQALSALTFLLDDFDPDKKYTYIELRRFKCFETTLIISMARPFEQSRGSTTLSLKKIGVKFNSDKRSLIDKICKLRNKVIAHSDQDEMHFYLNSFELTKLELVLPNLQFDEFLLLDYNELREIEVILRQLKNSLSEYIFDLVREQPEIIDFYKKPKSWGNQKKD
ncbi:hypothetical protein [Vibrio crassostreae]|uniref:hypothetical protein n=1 Tax=Vibrio crassostreae TaxID=246167 RepID=UPI001BD42F4D|nr:hypothetical protein [Vibrio crassostreae]